MEFRKRMEATRSLIEKSISEFIESERDRCPEDPHSREIFDNIAEFTLRDAKRIRAILVVEGYRAVGGKDDEKAFKASVALELIQSMLLIHDDVIDESLERRGSPSLHKVYESLHRERNYNGDPKSFGINMSIIAGDLAESLGEKALVTSGFPPERIIDALTIQSDMIRDTGFGQVMDILSEALPEWTEENVIDVQKYKTARYTLEGPLLIGASLHGMDVEQSKALSDFAIPVGISFQIIDDILGFYGDPKRGGKEDLADIKEGKRTLLIMKALEVVSDDERKMIMNALGNGNLTVEDAEKVRRIIRECGSEKYSRKMADELNRKGLASLETSSLDPDVKDFLEDLAEYLVTRA